MSEHEAPRGGAYDPQVVAQAASLFQFRAPSPIDPAALPNPQTAFEFIDRGWRPVLGLICGVGFAYNFIVAPAFEKREVEEPKLWVLVTLALGLAGAKTVERNRIGAPPVAGATG